MKEKLGNNEDQLIYYNCSWGGGVGYGLPLVGSCLLMNRDSYIYRGQEKLHATTINFAKGIKPDLTKPLGLTVIF